MPQEFQILRCCECEKFQVHHVKKAKKWQCKVCGLKQSMIRAFFIGSSCDCRVNVQKLNFQAGEQEMRRTLGESISSVDNEKPSFEKDNEDFDYPTENEMGRNGRINENDGMIENDWVDGNDWIDENEGMIENDWVDGNDWIDGIDEYSSEIVYNGKSPSDFEDELPRKKQRCESYPESKILEVDKNFNSSNEDVEEQGELLFSSILKCKQIGNSSEPIDSAYEIPSADVPKIESKQECGSFENKEENALPGVSKSRSNSVLKPSYGFQLILKEAKKAKTNLSFDLDW